MYSGIIIANNGLDIVHCQVLPQKVCKVSIHVLGMYLLVDFSAAQALHSEQCTPECWNYTLYSVPVCVCV